MTPVHASLARQSAFMLLLARYVSGQITESQWDRLNQVLDAKGVSINERMAIARIANEALSGQLAWLSDQDLSAEVVGLLSELRASRAA
ncbi:MAG: hypothetical protein ACPG3U_02715 [Rhodothermales bacterium]